jgi:hypothetical protein
MTASATAGWWPRRAAPRAGDAGSGLEIMLSSLSLADDHVLNSSDGSPRMVMARAAPGQRRVRKNWRMSPRSRSGASWAAQWLPRSNSLHDTMLA